MEKNENIELKYSKNDILRSKTLFSGTECDMLSVLLKDEEEYTIAECKTALEKESKRKVT